MPDAAAQAARELRWLLLSPPLLDTAPGAYSAPVQQFSATERAAISAWLAGVERAPHALLEAVNAAPARTGTSTRPLRPPSPRLGRRAERLLAFFLQHGPTHHLVASNIPLQHQAPDGSRSTRGEIDFLLRDAHGQGWHWELAVKFFLCTATGTQATVADFIGPDRAETFDHKLNKLFERQLRHQPPPPWDSETWTPAACTRGRLFYRLGQPVPVTAGLYTDHLQGHWIESDRLHDVPAAQKPVWHAVSRYDWMCPQPAPDALGQPLDALVAGLGDPWPAVAVMVVRDDAPAAPPLFVVNPPGLSPVD